MYYIIKERLTVLFHFIKPLFYKSCDEKKIFIITVQLLTFTIFAIAFCCSWWMKITRFTTDHTIALSADQTCQEA